MPGPATARALSRPSPPADLVQREIEEQYVDTRLAEEAEIPAVGVLLDQSHDLIEIETTVVGDPLRLDPGVGQ